MQGAFSCFRDTWDMTSAISSRVPVPPGKAMKASPSSNHFRLAPGHVLRDDEPGQTVVLIACVHEKLRLHTGDLAAGFQNAPGQAAHKTGFGPAVDQGVAAGPDPPAQLTDGALQRRVVAPAGAKINGDVHVHDSLRFSSLTIPGFAGKVQGNACQKGF